MSLDLARGEVLALLGENGAGKSTLVSILFGHYVADEGTITAFGKPLPPGDPAAALAAGIGMVHQHFTLADNLTVLDNILIGTEPLWQPFSRRRAARARVRETGKRFGLAVTPNARVADLSVGERQRVEILKALYRGARVLILDEPTAVLTPQESRDLFATLTAAGARGAVDHLHQPQARRGAGRVRPHRGAPERPARRHAAGAWRDQRRARRADGRAGGDDAYAPAPRRRRDRRRHSTARASATSAGIAFSTVST